MNTAMILRLILTQDVPSLGAIDADNAVRETFRTALSRHDDGSRSLARPARGQCAPLHLSVARRSRASWPRLLETRPESELPPARRKPRPPRCRSYRPDPIRTYPVTERRRIRYFKNTQQPRRRGPSRGASNPGRTPASHPPPGAHAAGRALRRPPTRLRARRDRSYAIFTFQKTGAVNLRMP